MTMRVLIILLLLKLSRQVEEVEIPDVQLNSLVGEVTSHHCHENGVVASWCDAQVNPHLKCTIHPTLDAYVCRCDGDPSACPSECVKDSVLSAKTHYGIQCRGIPKDEPNYIMRGGKLPRHHCENNAIVASWCNEWTVPDVDCLLLPSLDEYVCACHENAAACPEECVGGVAPDHKTKHGIRCKGIPVDQPNYVLQA